MAKKENKNANNWCEAYKFVHKKRWEIFRIPANSVI